MNPKISCHGHSHFSVMLIISAGILLYGCPEDMEEQPSFSYQEAPRRHSPEGSVPQAGTTSSRTSANPINHGAHLFSINCSHCHGPEGMGDGPVAGYLPDLPANLHAPAVQRKSDDELYTIVTKGEKMMPAFEKFLSQKERWAVVSFIRSIDDHAPSSNQMTPGINQDGIKPY